MSETAEATWDAAVAGLNVLTPERIEVSHTNDASLYELTKGSGMDGPQMYGVTVLTDSKIDTDRRELFHAGPRTPAARHPDNDAATPPARRRARRNALPNGGRGQRPHHVSW